MASVDSYRRLSTGYRRRNPDVTWTATVAVASALLVAACSAGTDLGRSNDPAPVTEQAEQADDQDSSGPGSGESSDGDGTDGDANDGNTADPETDPGADSGGGGAGGDEEPADGARLYYSLEQVPEEQLAALAELDGKLAIGALQSIAVARPDGRGYVEVDGDKSRVSGQPTWSRDGSRLVWSSVSSVSQEARIQTFDDEGVVDGEPARIPVPGHRIFYFQWNRDDSRILYLRNSTRRQTVEAGVIEPDGGAAWMADGNPFFVSWAPDELAVAGHVADEAILLFDPSGSRPLVTEPDTELPPVPPEGPVAGRFLADGGGFSAPVWLDDQSLLVVIDGWLSVVSIVDSEVTRLLELDGPVRFVVSPDRRQVALQLAGAFGADRPIEASFESGANTSTVPVQAGASLVVFDLETKGSSTVTDLPVVAWEWSPDGSKLAWLELVGPLVRRQGRWRFWTPDGPPAGDATAPTLTLTDKELENYLPFFAQYTQSITRWSPDSSAFALAGTADGRQGIWIHLVDQANPSVLVAPGDFVAWGPGPTPPASAGRSPA
ncbi:MAG: hypothetical protein OER95_10640 [Acidimicrobiia bacterium]|nr:hypothetical protein [Acidimicrobiia bacterium]